MNLRVDGTVEFDSRRDLVDYIRTFDWIECERDARALENFVGGYELVSDPEVRAADDGFISLTEGRLDLPFLEHLLEAAPGGTLANDRVILRLSVGGFTFQKNDSLDRWVCLEPARFGELPLGYDEDELQAELAVYGDAENVVDLISYALDEVVGGPELFTPDYRLFRSVEDDLLTVQAALDDLKYDGFFVDAFEYEWDEGVTRVGYHVFGWREGMESPVTDFSRDKLVNSAMAARYLAVTAGWLESPLGD